MLAAYARGIFPMDVDGQLGWWSPDPRCRIPLDGLIISSSLRKSMRKFRITTDTAFAEVVAGCASTARPHGWITAEFVAAYQRLHDRGQAHSVEAWAVGGESRKLAGGVFGIEIGGLFAAESMFHSITDGSKSALVGLVQLLAEAAEPQRRILDAQWLTPHLKSLGAVEVPRSDYLELLSDALSLPAAFPSRTT